MTAQFAEKLHYEGREVDMCTNPLDDYFVMGGSRPQFLATCTALWRGYIGEWEVVGGRLYLVGLKGLLEDGVEASVASIFPEFPRRVFAHWYSGTLRVPQGMQLEYVHMGYGSVFEEDIFLAVERGVVVNTRRRRNGTATSNEATKSYAIGAATMVAKSNQKERGVP